MILLPNLNLELPTVETTSGPLWATQINAILTQLDTSIGSLATITFDLTTPATGELLLYNGTDWANAAMSGDATIDSAGVITVTSNADLTGMVTSVGPATTVVTNANLTGGVTSVGNATTVITNANLTGGVTSSGNATTVVTNANLTGGVTSVGNAATVVTNANLTGGVTSVGNAATVITNANLTGGVTSVGNATTVVTNANLTGPVTSTGNATAIATGALSLDKITAGAAGQIIVGAVTTGIPTYVAMSGDISIDNAGLTAYVGTQPIATGGTGATSALAGFDALSPLTTGGDILFGGASGTGTRLANGSSGQVLTSAGTTLAPTWTTPAVTGANTALSNLAAVAINTSLISDTDNTDDLGSDSAEWKDIWCHAILHSSVGQPDLVIQVAGSNGDIQLYANGTGDVSVHDSNLTLLNTGTASELRFYEPSGSGTNYTGFIQPATAQSRTYQLPIDVPTNGQILQWETGEVLSWVDQTIGTGDVVGPATSTDHALARFDLTTGELLQDSVGILTDAGVLTGVTITESMISDFGSYQIKETDDIDETTFSGSDNQVSAANVTGFAFVNANTRSFKALVSVTVDATADLFEVKELMGIQRGADWELTATGGGDDSLVNFTITTLGQIQYTGGLYAGFVTMKINFRAITTNV